MPKPAEEHAEKIARAVADYVSSREVRYPDRPAAIEQSFAKLISAIKYALIDVGH